MSDHAGEASIALGLAGLAESEAARRRAAGQGNRLQPGAGRTYLRILLENAAAPVNVVLFGTCLVLLWLGLPIDAAVTSVPVLLNVLAGVVLEIRAKRQLDRLTIIARPVATVIREGREREIQPDELVVGDLMVATRGDQVILDAEIVDGSLELDESLLTGESDPVRRSPGEAVLSGSACLGGRAVLRVTRVGHESYANRLVLRAREARSERTPLQRDVARMVGATAVLVLGAGLLVSLDFLDAGALASREAAQAAAVLVAIVPQGLAIIATLLHAAGALAVGRTGALIQRINAVESMSRVDVLVLDKTGTLTSAALVLRRIEVPPDRGGGRGRAGAGGATRGTGDAAATVRRALSLMALPAAFTDRTTAAIRRWLAETAPEAAAIAPDAVAGTVPFTSDRRWSAVTPSAPAGSGTSLDASTRALLLGAPEVLLTRALDPGAGDLALLAETWAGEGLRVLLLARGEAGGGPRDDAAEPELPATLEPVALLGFEEQIRPDAAATLEQLERAGLRLKVASGDHRRTVTAIARRFGLPGEAEDGGALERLDDDALADRAEVVSILGRVSPATKARLIQALRRRGHYVAMIGDGVNDIIALKEANLGLAMQSGSPAARAAADVVLLGDAFGVLPRALVAGQRIVEGMRLVASLLLARTVYALLLVVLASILTPAFPMTPRTNSILALVTVGLPTLIIAAWAPAGRVTGGLLRSALRFAVPAGIAMVSVALPVYAAYLDAPGGVAAARTALTAVSVWCGILLIPFLLPPGRGRDLRPTLLAAGMAAVFALVLAVPPLRELFELAPIPPGEILLLAILAGLWAVILFRIRALRLVARLMLSWRRVTGAGAGARRSRR